MSRYVQEAPDGRSVVVGWDPPLRTYFGQVLDPEPEGPCSDPNCTSLGVLGEHELDQCQDNEPVVWVGFGAEMNDGIPNVVVLAERLGEYGQVALDHRKQLEADCRANPRTERSPAIQRMLDNLTGGGSG